MTKILRGSGTVPCLAHTQETARSTRAPTTILIMTVALLFAAAAGAEPNTGSASFFTWESCRREGTSGICANGKDLRTYENSYVCASWFYPLNSLVRVSTRESSIICKVVDRGPAKKLVRKGRIIDLNACAFKALAGGRLDKGILQGVNIERVR